MDLLNDLIESTNNLFNFEDNTHENFKNKGKKYKRKKCKSCKVKRGCKSGRCNKKSNESYHANRVSRNYLRDEFERDILYRDNVYNNSTIFPYIYDRNVLGLSYNGLPYFREFPNNLVNPIYRLNQYDNIPIYYENNKEYEIDKNNENNEIIEEKDKLIKELVQNSNKSNMNIIYIILLVVILYIFSK